MKEIKIGTDYILSVSEFGEHKGNYKVTVTSVEDRGDFLYIGYRAKGHTAFGFGYMRQYKDKRPMAIVKTLIEA